MEYAVEMLAKREVTKHEIDQLIKLLNEYKENLNNSRKVFFYPSIFKDVIKKFRKELREKCCISDNAWRNKLKDV